MAWKDQRSGTDASMTPPSLDAEQLRMIERNDTLAQDCSVQIHRSMLVRHLFVFAGDAGMPWFVRH